VEETDAPATQLLRQWKEGDAGAQDKLIELFYPYLQKRAAGLLADENHVSLMPSDLVHEAVIRIIKTEQMELNDRAHFMALASRLMRRILIDHVRAKNADKRAHKKVTLMTNHQEQPRFDLQTLNHALLRLAAIDSQRADIVEMRYFGAMSIADVAIATGLSEPTVKRRWASARVWLANAIEGEQ